MLLVFRPAQVMGVGHWGVTLQAIDGQIVLSVIYNVFNPPRRRKDDGDTGDKEDEEETVAEASCSAM